MNAAAVVVICHGLVARPIAAMIYALGTELDERGLILPQQTHPRRILIHLGL